VPVTRRCAGLPLIVVNCGVASLAGARGTTSALVVGELDDHLLS
jgi:hypothetical protein